MLKKLATAIDRLIHAQGGEHGIFETAIPNFALHRATHATSINHRLYRPAICVIAQGAKRVMVAKQNLMYRAGQALVVSLEMPLSGRIAVASEESPFLGVSIGFDMAVLREVYAELEPTQMQASKAGPAAYIVDLEDAVIDCALRAVLLLDTPKAIPVLYPAVMRELCYRLLTGPYGEKIAQLALAGNATQKISASIYKLRESFNKPLRVGDLAKTAQMSPSSFYQHFKALTSLSPLQYQKQLRLLEGRRLMMSGIVNAETAAYEVGYESASEFSREYSRMFGEPPRRDAVATMRKPLRRLTSLIA